MKRLAVLLPHKSNSRIFLCLLLLFIFFLFTFSSFTLHATELTAIPLESLPPEASNTENPTQEVPASELPLDKAFPVKAFSGTYYVTSSGGLNVRSGPSIQYDIIGSLPYGKEISVTGKAAHDWLEIPYEGTNGYISAKYLSQEAPTTLPAEMEELPETPEPITEEPISQQESVPFVSDTAMALLLLAIVAMIIIIIITVISFFHNNHKDS